MRGQSGTDQFQGQLSSFRATTDWPTIIVQTTGKFKIPGCTATRAIAFDGARAWSRSAHSVLLGCVCCSVP